jgi:hypothetical protein
LAAAPLFFTALVFCSEALWGLVAAGLLALGLGLAAGVLDDWAATPSAQLSRQAKINGVFTQQV